MRDAEKYDIIITHCVDREAHEERRKSMKKGVTGVLAVILAAGGMLLTARAAGGSPQENGWGKSYGQFRFQQEKNGADVIVFDAADMQKLYELIQ